MRSSSKSKRLRAFIAILCILIGGGGILAVNTLQFPSRQIAAETAAPFPVNQTEAAQRLAAAVRFPTLSGPTLDPAVFNSFRAYLQTSFPTVFQHLKSETIGHSLLLTWAGKQPQNPGALLLAHMDVVPVEPGTEKDWQYPPFSGAIHDGFVWGRGSIDDKSSVLAILEATETLLKQGYQPPHNLYLAFGHDEEVGGKDGAAKIAKALQQRGAKLAWTLDEGLAMVPGSMIGLQPPIALIGIAEKGYLTLHLKVKSEGGHASMPPRETAVGILSQALTRIQAEPMPPRLAGPARELFAYLGPEMRGFRKLAMANLWLFESVLLKQLQNGASTNALIRTTLAPTMLQASPKDNVMAIQAQATLNVRLLPGDNQASVETHLRQVINDPRVVLEAQEGFHAGASPTSSTQTPAFALLQRTIRQTYPEALVAPSLVLAGTDSRNYEALAKDQYRFQPLYLSQADLARIHGTNERVAIDNYAQAIAFYGRLIQGL